MKAEGSESRPGSKGIIEALIGAGIGFGFLPAVTALWQRQFHVEPPKWVEGAVPNLAGGVFLSLVFWLGRGTARRWINRHAGRTPRAKGDRVAIYVASFGDDQPGREARDSVIASLRGELAREHAEILPSGIKLKVREGVGLDEAAAEATARARALLTKKGGNLLIWGRLHTIDQRSVIELRFVSAVHDGSDERRFVFNDKLTLGAGFGIEVGATLAAVAASLALPATEKQGQYVADVLRPVADRLMPLVRGRLSSLRAEDRASLLFSYGLVQQEIGEQAGDSMRLEAAIEAYRAALKERNREGVPLEWAATQDRLGTALQSLGEGGSGTQRLEDAVAAYRVALEERTRERVPLDWAATQNRLGNALMILGERESGTARLEEAVAVYRAALEERTRERVPLYWAITQNNLGNALSILGERESGTARLEEAVAAYCAALQEETRQRVPLYWAMTQNNLGAALRILGERESGTARLEEAVAACRAALQERTRERVPLYWAMTQNNLGAALASLGERESGTARLEEAVAAYRAALSERTRERVPLDWAATQNNLGNALTSLGERESGTARLEEAIEAYSEALKECTPERTPRYHTMVHENLARVRVLLEARK